MRTQITTNGLLKSARRALKRPLSSVRSEKEQITAHHPLLYLQRLAGNQAAGRFIQAKLHISQPGDKYEQEADMMADCVMQAPESASVDIAPVSIPHFQRKCADCASGQGLCPTCAEEEETLQRKAQTRKADNGAPSASPIVENEINSLRGGGQPLAPSARSFFEPRFGYDFSNVRVYTNQAASKLSRDFNARAFTTGNDIVFGKGQYDPETTAGKSLLAHELTHVIQQTGGLARKSSQPHLIQRQTFPIPEFDELDPCIIVPPGLPPPLDKASGQQVCGSHAKKIKDLLKGKKKGAKKVICPPGFIPGTARGFENTCCKVTGDIQEGMEKRPTTTHNEQNCCAPEQIPSNGPDLRCCPPGTAPDPQKKNCVKSIITIPVCPDDRPASLLECLCLPPSRKNLVEHVCCPEGEVGASGKCEKEKVIPTKTPPTVSPTEISILFKFKRPAEGESGEAALNDSLFGEGRKNLDGLIAQLKSDPSMMVQLVGRASPEGDEAFNLNLGGRRARMIAEALKRAGIDQSRIANMSGAELGAGCVVLNPGVIACGEAGATGPADRQVAATIYTSKK